MDKLDIMRAIKSRGFKAKDIAEKLGISIVAMSQRANKDNPTVKSLREVAEIIGCDVRDLFYKVDENGNIVEENDSQQDLFARTDASEAIMEHEQKKMLNGEIDITDAEYAADHAIRIPDPQATAKVETFCPHCGKRVRVGVVLLPEE